jgi:hypothetical protein
MFTVLLPPENPTSDTSVTCLLVILTPTLIVTKKTDLMMTHVPKHVVLATPSTGNSVVSTGMK